MEHENQIKFRVWDYDQNKMLDPETYKIEFHHNHTFVVIGMSDVTTNIKIMRWTGLKDVNNKDIYEGDIVEFVSQARVIGWNKEYAQFGWDNPLVVPVKAMDYGMGWSISELSNLELIGNIMENQDLLK